MSVIEPSKSSRAKCRICKEKIKRGNARLGIESEFKKNNRTFVSMKWHHLSCARTHMPDSILTAKLIEEIEVGKKHNKKLRLSQEDLDAINEIKNKYNISGVSVKSLSDIEKDSKKVNAEGKILKKMTKRKMEHPDGTEKDCTVVFVTDDNVKTKLHLWDEFSNMDLVKGDQIVLIKGKVDLGLNDNIQLHTDADSKVLINPTEQEISKAIGNVDLYVSKAWRRPTGKIAEFTYAPSGRAMCVVCDDKISKGELKVVKPEFLEVPNQNRKIPGHISLHLECTIDDEHGEEVLHEAVTRLTPDLIEDNHEDLEELCEFLPEDIQARELLETLLN